MKDSVKYFFDFFPYVLRISLEKKYREYTRFVQSKEKNEAVTISAFQCITGC